MLLTVYSDFRVQVDPGEIRDEMVEGTPPWVKAMRIAIKRYAEVAAIGV